MPLNEAAGYRRSNLTHAQQRQAEAAIFGIQENTLSTELTIDEIERMREIVLQHDSKNPKMAQEFDLAKPPVPQYRYQEFPRMLYKPGGATKVVNSQDHMDDALADGWSKQPVFDQPFVEVEQESPEPVGEEPPRRGPGRPRKIQE